MSSMQSEVFEDFRAINIPEDEALKVAAALAGRDDDGASMKSDVGSIKSEMTSIRNELALMRWVLGFVFAIELAIFVKLFVH